MFVFHCNRTECGCYPNKHADWHWHWHARLIGQQTDAYTYSNVQRFSHPFPVHTPQLHSLTHKCAHTHTHRWMQTYWQDWVLLSSHHSFMKHSPLKAPFMLTGPESLTWWLKYTLWWWLSCWLQFSHHWPHPSKHKYCIFCISCTLFPQENT